jgi:hypothetical protein
MKKKAPYTKNVTELSDKWKSKSSYHSLNGDKQN